jgi:hypothetical protein
VAYILVYVAVLFILLATFMLIKPNKASDARVRRGTNKGWRADRGRVILMTSGPTTRLKSKPKVKYIDHEPAQENPRIGNRGSKTKWVQPANLFPQKGSVEETLSKVTSRIPKRLTANTSIPSQPIYDHNEIEVRTDSELHQENEPLTAAEHLSYFDRYVYTLSKLIRDSKERMRTLEQQFIDQLSSTNSEFNQNIVTARRIIGALESRLVRLQELNPHESQDGFSLSKSMLKEPLVVPRDAVSALLSSEDLPPLQPSQWESALDSFIAKAEVFFLESGRQKKKVASGY